jgi:hypothetical protein
VAVGAGLDEVDEVQPALGWNRGEELDNRVPADEPQRRSTMAAGSAPMSVSWSSSASG